MKTHYGVAAVAMTLTGFAVGAATMSGLHAQAKPAGYVIIDISETMDAAAYIKAVSAAEPNATTSAGGRFIIRTNAPVALDGDPPNRFVVIAFESVAKAKAWANTPAIKEVNAVRMKTTKSRAFVVEGLAN
jgi:uncharacterized protein (DUF1330 family)